MSSKTSEGLSIILGKFLDDMLLRDKLSFLLGDNCSTNFAMCEQPALRQDKGPVVPFKKKHSFCRCLAHVVHLEAVQVIGLFQETCKKVSGRNNGYKVLTDAVHSMHTSSQRNKRWYELCVEHGKRTRLLPREVKTRWASFDQLLVLAVEYKDVLDDFMASEDYGFPKGFWEFCAMISKYTTKPLREITEVAMKDTSLSAMSVCLLYYAIQKLEDGLLKMSAKLAMTSEDVDPVSFYLDAYCRLAVTNLGLKLRSYFNHYKKDMEKFKFLFVPYNVWWYGHEMSSHLREILGWGEITDLESFMLKTLNDREVFEDRSSPSMFRLRLSSLNDANAGLKNNGSRVTYTSMGGNGSDPPSSPPSPQYEITVTPRPSHTGNLNSSPMSEEDREMSLLDRGTSYSEPRTIPAIPSNSLKSHVNVYFKHCSNDDQYNGHKNMKRGADESIQSYMQRMADDAMVYWKTGSVSVPLREVAMSVLSAPGSNAYVERVFSSIKDIPTDRRHKLSYDTIQRLSLSKFAVNYKHVPLGQLEGEFVNNYVDKAYSDFGDNDQNESDIVPTEFLQPENMFGWADIKADKVNLLRSVEKDDYFHPKYYDKIMENLEKSVISSEKRS